MNAALAPALPLLSRLGKTPQEPEWHAEGAVAVHTALVQREVHALADTHALSPERRLSLLLGALLHDVGKVLTTREEQDAAGRSALCRRATPSGAARMPRTAWAGSAWTGPRSWARSG